MKSTNTINKLKEKYNLKVQSPFEIKIIGGYGAEHGMVIDSSWSKIGPVAEELVERGYGYSCFDLSEDTEGFNKVLKDWGKV